MYSDRRSLLLLALIAVLPLFLFGSFYFAFQAQNREREVERNARADAQLVIARSDGLLRESLAASQGLATTGAIAATDIALAATRAEEFRRNNQGWVEVALDDNGRRARLFDLGQTSPAGPFLEPGQMRLGLRREGDCRCVVISRGLASVDGRGRTLHIALSNASFFRLMPRAHGEYEVSALADERGHFVARSIDDTGRFATPGSIDLRRAARYPAQIGFYRGTTLEGTGNYTAFARSEVSGWSAHVAMKAQRIDDPALAFWISIGAATFLSLVLAGLLYLVAKQQIEATRAVTRRIQEAQKLEALGQLTGGMAHDFNNLLTPIVGALDRLRHSDNLDAREKRFAKGAFESAERAASLTAQLLTFSRRQKLEIKVVDVAKVLKDACELAGQSLDVRHDLDCSTEPGTPPVATDKVQLELAILNLILNARDAMSNGGQVRVRAAPIRDGGRPSVVFSVADLGSGMDPETASRALEPFFTTKPQGAGTGLGLAQVAEVAKQSGGRIEIDSELGNGTIIRLTLPAVQASAAAAADPKVGHGRELPEKLKLLIVDDNADVRETIVQMVEADGHRVESVADGRTALAAMSNRKPDLVLVDFAMPGLNGAELISKAHDIHPGLPCLLITGYWDSDALADYGVTCPILRKPFTNEALRDAMAAALGQG
ncbi:MAG: response regulator [Sphingomonas bacterium]|nr:response regulator [Sphingomonas bacterium]